MDRAVLSALAAALPRSGLLDPRHLPRHLLAQRAWDRTPAGLLAGQARSRPDRVLLHDELGALSYGQIDARTNAIARGLRTTGAGPGTPVALMCRNGRGFVEGMLACSKLGTTTTLLNTDFAGPQLADVVAREQPVAIICDEEFLDLLSSVDPAVPRIIAWHDEAVDHPTLEAFAGGERAPLPPPPAPGRVTILSSGTTGTPKGVQRAGSTPLLPLIGVLAAIPLRSGDTHVIPAPMFHGWGFLHLALSLLLGCTVVTRRRFDPECTLHLVDRHRAAAVPMVPVMLQRIMALPTAARSRHDVSCLRTIPLAGSAIPAGLAVRAMDALGDVVYNVYGSTECALATIAGPRDLREAPGTAGRPILGTPVRVLDAHDRPAAPGETGVVFVGSAMASDGYSGGGAKRAVDGLLSSGDLGHFDAQGRLFIDGREDEMIVSGGENVYPGEVEDLLVGHPLIADAAVVGVPDPDFGQRLHAFVVCKPGRELDADEVSDFVRSHLARYKVPRAVEFLDELPRNPTGKVLKRELVAG